MIRISTIRDHMMPAIGRRGHGRVKGMTDAASNAQHKYCAILFLVAISSDIFCISTNSFLFPRSVDGTNDKSCLGGDVYRFSLHCGSLIGGGWRTFLVCSRAVKEPLFYNAPNSKASLNKVYLMSS